MTGLPLVYPFCEERPRSLQNALTTERRPAGA